MATLSTFTCLNSTIPTLNSQTIQSHSHSLPLKNLHFNSHAQFPTSNKSLKGNQKPFLQKLKSVEGDTQQETETPLQEQAEEQPQQTVSVPVSSTDTLTMFFQAEGTMNEAAIPTVTKALEGSEGISDLRVQVVEGIASVQLTKGTTVQATGVASSLVELIQGSGFKLQTLNLSFADAEDAALV
ncbi:uncharacterized protein LOC126674437 [Mercurialis annua]|uniref:uncharacterized protein LOC126674437 n=1 Tax=Mercurialis annua TaxID=3986 RepID=UPI00215EC4E3|nr:uncharacterized protein LOC126674437 [Mercurialis annua]